MQGAWGCIACERGRFDHNGDPSPLPQLPAADATGRSRWRPFPALLPVNLQVSSELLQGTRLQIRRAEYDSAEYCHWSFPDDDPAQAEPSYMMARRLRPRERRGTPVPGGALERLQPLMLAERPPVRPSGKRAAFIQAIEDAKIATDERRRVLEESAWHQVCRYGRSLAGQLPISYPRGGTGGRPALRGRLRRVQGVPLDTTHASPRNRCVPSDERMLVPARATSRSAPHNKPISAMWVLQGTCHSRAGTAEPPPSCARPGSPCPPPSPSRPPFDPFLPGCFG